MVTIGPGRMSRSVRNLLIANVVVYVCQIVPTLGMSLLSIGMLVPSYVFARGQVWRLVSYLFLHDPVNPMHLLFNMLALWMFGVELELIWGTRRFTTFYFIGGIGAALFSAVMWNVPIIGASGAVLALLTAYAYCFPNRTVLMFFIFPVPVRVAVMIIGFISLLLSFGGGGGIAHLTHLGGIVVALLYLKAYPAGVRYVAGLREREDQRRQRRTHEERMRAERYYEEVVDPILRKISEQGMDSLTAAERRTLQDASKRHRERLREERIIPVDFRHGTGSRRGPQ
jgi:membrane associated rhomboid family serine protease